MSDYQKAFEAEYLARTGIAFVIGGGTIEEIERYEGLGYTPTQAVTNEIRRYGMDDHLNQAASRHSN